MATRMKLPTMSIGGALKKFQEYPISNQDSSRNVFTVNWMAMIFKVATSHRLTQVVLPLFKTGSPGNVSVSIQALSGGDPDGTDLATPTVIPDSALGTANPAPMKVIQMSGVNLTATVSYAIVVRSDAGDASNTVNWNTDDSSPTYSDGNREDSGNSGNTWTAQTGTDMCFEEWGLES